MTIIGGSGSTYPVAETKQTGKTNQNSGIDTVPSETKATAPKPQTTVPQGVPNSTELNNDAKTISQPGTTVNPAKAEALSSFGGTGIGTHIRSDYSETLSTSGSKALPFGTAAERLVALDRISQVDDDNNNTMFDRERCGPASIVAAAYYAGGRDGLSQLITDVKAYNNTHQTGINLNSVIGNLETRLKNGGAVTQQDLENLQEGLYLVLNSQQDATINADGSYTGHGLHHDMISGFIKESPNVKSMFDNNDMAIALVDTDGVDGGNHFVLGFKDQQGKSTVYDPYPIGTGSTQDQVTQDQAVIDKYLAARETINGSKFVYDGGS